jgi:hypothetical protein
MRDKVLTVLVSLALFAMGFVAGLWAERHRSIPPPPGAFMGEFGPHSGPMGSGPRGQHTPPPLNRAQVVDQINRLRPEIEAFTARINEIYAQFDRDLDPILNPDQKKAYDEQFRARRNVGPPPEMLKDPRPLSDEQVFDLMQRPMRTLAYFVVLPMTLDRMNSVLKLDEVQQGKVRDLLRVRREKFLELVDSAPPPSLNLSRLAPFAQRLVEPKGAPSAEAPPGMPSH